MTTTEQNSGSTKRSSTRVNNILKKKLNNPKIQIKEIILRTKQSHLQHVRANGKIEMICSCLNPGKVPIENRVQRYSSPKPSRLVTLNVVTTQTAKDLKRQRPYSHTFLVVLDLPKAFVSVSHTMFFEDILQFTC